MKKVLFSVVALAGLSAGAAWGQGAAPAPPPRSIVQVSGDVYRFQNNQHYGLFQVTPAGIIVVDPINASAAEWLKGELATRFNVPVKYVLYSHHDWDHAAGAAVFTEAAVVSHAATVASLEPPPETAPLGANQAAADSNHDQKLQVSETTPQVAAQFAKLDKNGDGGLSAREFFQNQYADVKAPTQTYKTPVHKVTLGGKTVEMHYVKSKHADDLSYIYFPAEKILFVVDVISPKRLPFGTLGGYDEADSFAAVDRALAFDAKIVVGGHGAIGADPDVEAVRTYLKDLRQGVQKGIDSGQSVEQIQASLTLDKYKDWINYDTHRTQNIAGMYAYLKH